MGRLELLTLRLKLKTFSQTGIYFVLNRRRTLCRSLEDEYSGVFIKTTVWAGYWGRRGSASRSVPGFFPRFSYWFSILSIVFLSKSGDCSENRANHHDNHKHAHSHPPHVFPQTCTNTPLQVPRAGQSEWRHTRPRPQWKRKKRRREGRREELQVWRSDP